MIFLITKTDCNTKKGTREMKIKCIVKGCENHKDEGGFEDGICLPCYLFITTGEGIYSQAYRNAKPAELTDEEIEECYWGDGYPDNPRHPKEFAYAILRKAQEK